MAPDTQYFISADSELGVYKTASEGGHRLALSGSCCVVLRAVARGVTLTAVIPADTEVQYFPGPDVLSGTTTPLVRLTVLEASPGLGI